jgi:putative oxidoreductase
MKADMAAPAFAPDWRARLTTARAWLQSLPRSIFQLAFRVALAGIFWSSGQSKIASWDTTIVLFRDEYRVPLLPPELAATMATAVELICPVLLLLGLATRLATVPMLAMTFVIQVFVYPESWTVHLTWAAMLLYLLSRGPGPLAIDHLLARHFLNGRA